MNRKEPFYIRNHVEDFGDPYIPQERYEDNTACKRCGDIYMSGRWYSKDLLPEKMLGESPSAAVVCPACRKQIDRVPGGVLKITGDFFPTHRDEVLNLIRNETEKAQASNPLERVMSIYSTGGVTEVTTTNEKLAQKIGKALRKAYHGVIEYKFSADSKLARVDWHR